MTNRFHYAETVSELQARLDAGTATPTDLETARAISMGPTQTAFKDRGTTTPSEQPWYSNLGNTWIGRGQGPNQLTTPPPPPATKEQQDQAWQKTIEQLSSRPPWAGGK